MELELGSAIKNSESLYITPSVHPRLKKLLFQSVNHLGTDPARVCLTSLLVRALMFHVLWPYDFILFAIDMRL